MAFTDEQLTTIRQQLGLPEDADEATILAGLQEALNERADPAVVPTTPEAPATPPEGVLTVDAGTFQELQAAAANGTAALERQQREDRERLVNAACADGRIPAGRRDHHLHALEVDPEGHAAVLASLAPGLVPLGTSGHAKNEVTDDVRRTPAYINWTV